MPSTLVQQLKEAYTASSGTEGLRRKRIVIKENQYQILDAFLNQHPVAMQAYSGTGGYARFVDTTLSRLGSPHDVPRSVSTLVDDEIQRIIGSMNAVGFGSYPHTRFFTTSVRSHKLAGEAQQNIPIVAGLGITAAAVAGFVADLTSGQGQRGEDAFIYGLVVPGLIGAAVATVANYRLNRNVDKEFEAEARDLRRTAISTDQGLDRFRYNRLQNDVLYTPNFD